MKNIQDIQNIIQNNQEIYKFFEKILFEYINECQVRYYKCDDIVVNQQYNAENCYYVVLGELIVYNEFANGKSYIFEKVVHGDIIGEMEVLTNSKTYMSSVECKTDCVIILIPNFLYRYWLNTYHIFAIDVANRLAKMMSYIAVKRAEILTYSKDKSFSNILISYCPKNFKKAFFITDTHQILSEKLGLSLRTVNRIIQKFNKAGYISLEKGKILIKPEQYELLLNIK